MPAVVQEVTGPVSFLVKLQDGRLTRRHQDHLRRRIPDGEDGKPVSDDFPEILTRFLLHQTSQMMAQHQEIPSGPVQQLIPLRHPQLMSLLLTLRLQLLRMMISSQVHLIPLDYLRLIPKDSVNNQTSFIIIDFFFMACEHHASFIELSFVI